MKSVVTRTKKENKQNALILCLLCFFSVLSSVHLLCFCNPAVLLRQGLLILSIKKEREDG